MSKIVLPKMKNMTIDDMKASLEWRPDTISLDTYYATKEWVQNVLQEIEVKLPIVQSGMDEFTECEKLAFAIVVKTLE